MPAPWLASAHAILSPVLAFVLALAAGVASAQPARRLGDPATDGGAAVRTPRAAGDRAGLGRVLGAPAEPAREALGWALDVSAVTSVPLAIGVEANVQSPLGITGHLSLGHTPSAYLDAVATTRRGAGVYGANEEPLVREAIASGAWNVRLGVGFTLPEGLELAIGYTYLTGSASLSPNAIEAAVGHPVRWPGMTVVPLSVGAHALHARVGWRFVFERHFVVRAAIGWTHALATSAHVEVPAAYDPPGGPADRMEDGIERALGSYGFTPELVLSAGYRF